jgi:hypothetical protein
MDDRVKQITKAKRIGGIFCKSSQYMMKKPMWGLSRCIMAHKDDYHVLIEYE